MFIILTCFLDFVFIRSLCAVDITHFPFDYQECRLTFGSWAYSGLQVDLRNYSESADMTSYVKNVEWQVLGVPAERTVVWYKDEPYPTVTFFIKLQVKPFYWHKLLAITICTMY